MSPSRILRSLIASAAVLVAASAGTAAKAEEIVASNYGVTVNGMPFAVAKALGYFKQEGAEVFEVHTLGRAAATAIERV